MANVKRNVNIAKETIGRGKGGLHTDRPLMLSEFPELLNDNLSNIVLDTVIEINYTDLVTLKSNAQLVENVIYKITDRFNYQATAITAPNPTFRGDDRGIVYVRALSTSMLSKEAIRVMYCPRYYDAATHSGFTYIGVYHSSKAVNVNEIAVWGGATWQNITGGIGNEIDEIHLDSTNWVKIAKEVEEVQQYVNKQFSVFYDFENDWFDRQWDEAGNIVGVNYNQTINYEALSYNPCDITDWNFIAGRENSSVFSEDVQPLGIYNNDNDGYIICNKALSQGSRIANNTNTGSILNNTRAVINNLNNGIIRDNTEDVVNLGSDVESCINNQVTNNGNSIFEVDITSITALSIPYSTYQKQVLLTSSNLTESISTISVMRPSSCRFNIKSGLTVTFIHNVTEILCEGAVNAVLNGTNSDWIELEKDYNGKYKQVNIGQY